jgi:hypothetical protein
LRSRFTLATAVHLVKHSHTFEMLLEGFRIIPYKCHFPYLILLTLLKLSHNSIKRAYRSLTKKSRLETVVNGCPHWQHLGSSEGNSRRYPNNCLKRHRMIKSAVDCLDEADSCLYIITLVYPSYSLCRVWSGYMKGSWRHLPTSVGAGRYSPEEDAVPRYILRPIPYPATGRA